MATGMGAVPTPSPLSVRATATWHPSAFEVMMPPTAAYHHFREQLHLRHDRAGLTTPAKSTTCIYGRDLDTMGYPLRMRAHKGT
ncbi:MAG: hypothetical protein ACLUEK_08435 [Oscillospiraceae bacterium]